MSILLESALTAEQRAAADATDRATQTRSVSWLAMSDIQRRITLAAMDQCGSRFARRAAALWQCADTVQCLALERAFPDLLREHGPGTEAYAAAQLIEGKML